MRAIVRPRPRIDLDGVALSAEGGDGATVALLRSRTRAGLVLQVPESADVLLPWADVVDATVDLRSGRVRVTLTDTLVHAESWLRGARTLVGRWVDRVELDSPPGPTDA